MLASLLLALPVAVLTIGYWTEWRGRLHAERSRDAVRADAIRLLVALEDRLDDADRQIRRWHEVMPQAITLDPDHEHIRDAARMVHSARSIASQGRTLLGG